MVASVWWALLVDPRAGPTLQTRFRIQYFLGELAGRITNGHSFYVIPCGRFRVGGFSTGFESSGGGGGGGGAPNSSLSTERAENPALCAVGNAANGETMLSSFEFPNGISLVPGGAGCSFTFLGILYADFRLYSNSPANTIFVANAIFGKPDVFLHLTRE